jgi:putative ABC transport system ATP-binding protein
MNQHQLPPAIEARSLYRFFRAGDEETLALQGISLTVAPGELIAVIGPSGSGKSTLLSCLAGIDEPSGGSVQVGSERISHQPEAVRDRLRARHIGLLFQSANLFSHLTVRRNIELAQRLAGRGVDTTPPMELLKSLGLAARASALPAELSGGESARAGLAVALANDPQVVLADEPTGELDSATEAELISLLRERTERHVAVLVASHSPAIAHAADRIIELQDGRLVA